MQISFYKLFFSAVLELIYFHACLFSGQELDNIPIITEAEYDNFAFTLKRLKNDNNYEENDEYSEYFE